MDKNKLNDALKNIDPEKLSQVKSAIEGKDLSELLSGLDIKKAGDALKEFNIDSSKLGGIISEIKKKPDILNEIKNKLR